VPRTSRTLLSVGVAAVLVTAVVVGIGVLRRTPPPKAPVDPLATPLSAVDTTGLTVRRASFCVRVGDRTAAAALGAPVSTRASYRPGQSVAVTPTLTDVVDEYGCSWSAASGATARFWVFGPPVTAAQAQRLAAQVPPGCTRAKAPAYGAPTSALTCDGTVLLRGLFGDAWLSCELTTASVGRAGRWCLAVARAAS